MKYVSPLSEDEIEELAHLADRKPPSIEWNNVADQIAKEDYRAVMVRMAALQRERHAMKMKNRSPTEVNRDAAFWRRVDEDATHGVRRFYGNIGEPMTEEEYRRAPMLVSNDYIADPVLRKKNELTKRLNRLISGSVADRSHDLRWLVPDVSALLSKQRDATTLNLAHQTLTQIETLRRDLSSNPRRKSERIDARLALVWRELKEQVDDGYAEP